MVFQKGDLFSLDVEALVNPVNCVGVMGKGLALGFKKAYPENFKAYRTACKNGHVILGQMFVFETNQSKNPRFIINFPTKQHWRNKSRMEDIETGLADLVEVIQELNIQSICIPALGAGLGGLDWLKVKDRIVNTLAPIAEKVRILVLEPC